MPPTVRIVASDPPYGKSLLNELSDRGYDTVIGIEEHMDRCWFGVICLGIDSTLPAPPLPQYLACRFPLVLSPVSPLCPFPAETFRKGAYRHITLAPDQYGDPSAVAVSLIEHFEDLLSMAKIMGQLDGMETQAQWSEALTNDLDLGIAVIDRSFRTWYRNDAHRRIAGTATTDCPLCWVAYHGLDNRITPCEACPSATLFADNTTTPIGPIPMVIGFQPPESDPRPARPTEVRVLPLYDNGRASVVGAIEIVRDISFQLETKNDPDITEWIEHILRRVFGDRFKRSRLFLLSPNKKYLMGFAAVGTPLPAVPIKTLQVPVESGVPGTPMHLPETPTLMHVSNFPNGLPLYCKVFDKDRAPYWADLPLVATDGKVLGKVVVDNWSEVEAERCISQQSLEGLDKGLTLLANIIQHARALTRARERIAVADATRYFLTGGSTTAPGLVLQDAGRVLLDATSQVPGVVSALIRKLTIQKDGTHVLQTLDGFGAYYDHCRRNLSVKDSLVTGTVLSSPNEDWVVVATKPETLQLSEDSLADVKPERHRQQIESIQFQGTFRIGPRHGLEEGLFLCVQADDFTVFEHDTLKLLTRAADLALTLNNFTEQLSNCFLAVMQLHDVDTAAHSTHVAQISRMLAECVKDASPPRAYIAGSLHDIGKIGLSRDVLRGHTRLTLAEQWYVRAHVDVGADVLHGLTELQDVATAVREHHMWYNKTAGYPQAEADYEISPMGRILAVADCLEAMTSPTRYYRKAKPLSAALKEIRSESGTHFCPEAVRALGERWADISIYLHEHRDNDR